VKTLILMLVVVGLSGCDGPHYDSAFCRERRIEHDAFEQCKKLDYCKITSGQIVEDLKSVRYFPSCFSADDK